MSMEIHGTTILSVRKNNKVVVIADGQASLGNTIIKSSTRKLRTLANGNVITGFAGSTADGMTLFERLEKKVEQYDGQLMRACVELAKDWRQDKYLRKLEAMLIAADKNVTLMVTGMGDVLEPEDGVLAIGSGGHYALSAARALIDIKNMTAEKIADKAMNIAADICVFSNHNFIKEVIEY